MILFLIIFVKDIAKIVSGKLLLLKCAIKVVTEGRDGGRGCICCWFDVPIEGQKI